MVCERRCKRQRLPLSSRPDVIPFFFVSLKRHSNRSIPSHTPTPSHSPTEPIAGRSSPWTAPWSMDCRPRAPSCALSHCRPRSTRWHPPAHRPAVAHQTRSTGWSRTRPTADRTTDCPCRCSAVGEIVASQTCWGVMDRSLPVLCCIGAGHGLVVGLLRRCVRPADWESQEMWDRDHMPLWSVFFVMFAWTTLLPHFLKLQERTCSLDFYFLMAHGMTESMTQKSEMLSRIKPFVIGTILKACDNQFCSMLIMYLKWLLVGTILIQQLIANLLVNV